MKKTLLAAAFLATAISFSSCREGERKYGDADGVDIIPDEMQDEEEVEPSDTVHVDDMDSTIIAE
ncbi:MAG: hypothetical protein LPJ89_03435 [Hymenobacteraceae bacterium]|nr:hypothetical protein [Hymenobacteraceae bacterium]MDX5396130.1 hypothetical protein [Hymenobacteraceae bacterium]MDX5442816.1 hypothetical protein [Hymenobacteraceae bacterium]MDX5512191.1 hypothetical protein [Hymenobacteraceae bacterium]